MAATTGTEVAQGLSQASQTRDVDRKLTSARIWNLFFTQCLYERVQAQDFSKLSNQLWQEQRISGMALVDQLLSLQRPHTTTVDSLYVVYLECLLQAKRVTLPDCLDALLRHSRYRQHKAPETPVNSPELECAIIVFVTRQMLTNGGAVASTPVRLLLHALLEWLRAVVKSNQVLVDPQGVQACDAVGVLAVSVLENVEVVKAATALQQTMLIKYLAGILPQFITLWSQGGSQAAAENAARLIMVTKTQPGLEDKKTTADEKATAIAQATLQVQAIADLGILPSRPAMFVFLSSLIFARPVSDDVTVLNYLQTRYKINHQLDIEVLAADLIVGGFDVLSSVALRKENERTMLAHKSFLIHKVPLWLTSLFATMFSVDRSEYCVSQALARVDNVIFPPPSLGLMSDNGLQDVRQDFLCACAVHSIIRVSSIESILGEQPNYSTPPDPSARLVPAVLFEQVNADSDKLTAVVNDIGKLDGNGGARANVVGQVIRNLCLAKDTMALKPICNTLSAQPQCIDILVQFMAPTVLLQPLCELLDDWRYDDDQGEYQPVYEEFAAAFLLAYSIIARYDLAAHEIGIPQQSFMARYLQSSSTVRAPDDISEDDKKCFATWTKGLHNPDSITDAVLSCCKPQEFYLLAPTIFGYLVYAIVNKIVKVDAVKTPLEYLCEPFLVPSMIGIISWLQQLIWKSKNIHQKSPAAAAEQLVGFNLLMKICRTTAEASEAHKSVVKIMARSSLSAARRVMIEYPQFAKQPNVEPFVPYLQNLGTFQKTIIESLTDLDAEVKSMGSLQNMLRSTIQTLISWAAMTASNPVQQAPQYDPTALHQALHIAGARSVLAVMIDEIKKQSAANNAITAVAIDVVAALISMPIPMSQTGQTDWLHLGSSQPDSRMSLREALRLEFDEVAKVIRQDLQHAELVVRLHRRVEAQLAFSSTENVADLNTQAMLTDLGAIAANEVAVAAAAAAVANVDAAAAAAVADTMDFTDTTGVTGDAMDLGISLSLDATGDLDLLGGGGGGEDDIFAGLMGDNDMNFNDW